MAERSALNQTIQIGVETTPGTGVAATKKLQSLSIEPSLTVQKSEFRPTGQKYQALSILGKEWTTAAIAGRATYDELVYMFASVMTTPVITTPDITLTPLGRKWVFTPNAFTDDTPKTFTVEHGSSVRADRFVYGLVTDIGLVYSRDAVEVTGSMMGRALEDNFTLTPTGVTTVPLVPVVPTQVSVYLDPTFGALGTTKLLRVLNTEFHLGTRYGPVWVLDAANPSYVNHIEIQPDLHATILLEADAAGMALLTALRDGSTRFMRIEAIGANLGTGTVFYRHAVDMAVKVSGTGGFSDSNGVYAIEFNFIGVYDSGWGKAVEVTAINTTTAL